MGGVDHQVAGVILGSLFGGNFFAAFRGSGGFGRGFGLLGSLAAASGQTQDHDQSQKQSKDLLHIVFLLISYMPSQRIRCKSLSGSRTGMCRNCLFWYPF